MIFPHVSSLVPLALSVDSDLRLRQCPSSEHIVRGRGWRGLRQWMDVGRKRIPVPVAPVGASGREQILLLNSNYSPLARTYCFPYGHDTATSLV